MHDLLDTSNRFITSLLLYWMTENLYHISFKIVTVQSGPSSSTKHLKGSIVKIDISILGKFVNICDQL